MTPSLPSIHAPLMRCLLCLCLLSYAMGCTKAVKQPRDPKLPKSDNPIVKLLQHRGALVKYNVYNTSNKTFVGLVIVFDGEGCEGPRSRRLLVKVTAKPLASRQVRPFAHKMPYSCEKMRLTAFDIPTFRRRIRKEHHPFARFTFDKATSRLKFTVQNRSVLPFRGLAVIVTGSLCEGPKPKQIWVLGFKKWLYPGHERSEGMRVPARCNKIDVEAKDLIVFLKQRAAYIKKQRALQKKLQNDANRLLKGF